MVRLKANMAVRKRKSFAPFQFHNGSIKSAYSNGRVCSFCMCFNSTMVRLKVDFVKHVMGFFEMFQFHNGSIKRTLIGCDKDRNTMFQFHNGSIKSVIPSNHQNLQISFNSTMVRLKVRSVKPTMKELSVSIPQWFD